MLTSISSGILDDGRCGEVVQGARESLDVVPASSACRLFAGVVNRVLSCCVASGSGTTSTSSDLSIGSGIVPCFGSFVARPRTRWDITARRKGRRASPCRVRASRSHTESCLELAVSCEFDLRLAISHTPLSHASA